MAKVSVGAIESVWTCTPDEMAVIHAATSCFIDGADMSPRFKNHQWDGMLRMFNPNTGKLPSGLVEDAVAALQGAGFEVEIFSNTPPAPERQGAEIYFELDKTHQIETLEAMSTRTRGIFHGATNAGKTKIAEAWCALHGLNTLFLVPSQELLDQTVASFKRDTNLDVGQISASDDWVLGKDVTICLVTSVAKRVSRTTKKLLNEKAVIAFRKIAPQFQAVFVDECHHLTAKTYQYVMRCLKNAHYRFALSGTPWKNRVEELKIKQHLGPIFKVVTNKELIDKGWSAKPTINMLWYDSNSDVSLTSGFDYDDYAAMYETLIVKNSLRNEAVSKICQKVSALKKTVLVIADRVEHCYALGDLCKKEGLGHRVITGQRTKKPDRAAYLAEFKNRQIPVLITNVVNEGIDIPSLNAVILVSGGKSKTRLIQRIGRGIRKKETGENSVEIYDFMDIASPALREHTMQRLAICKSEGFEITNTLI